MVPDAEADVRFSSNPLVTGHPDIRFYAGAQLVMEGDGQERLGTLCVIDTKPRDLTDTQRSILNSLVRLILYVFTKKMDDLFVEKDLYI